MHTFWWNINERIYKWRTQMNIPKICRDTSILKLKYKYLNVRLKSVLKTYCSFNHMYLYVLERDFSWFSVLFHFFFSIYCLDKQLFIIYICIHIIINFLRLFRCMYYAAFKLFASVVNNNNLIMTYNVKKLININNFMR